MPKITLLPFKTYPSQSAETLPASPQRELTRENLLHDAGDLLKVCLDRSARLKALRENASARQKKAAVKVLRHHSGRLDKLSHTDLETLSDSRLHDLLFELSDIYSDLDQALSVK